jgi:hypothetical protein
LEIPGHGGIEHALDEANLNPEYHIVKPAQSVVKETMDPLDPERIQGGTKTIHLRRTGGIEPRAGSDSFSE